MWDALPASGLGSWPVAPPLRLGSLLLWKFRVVLDGEIWVGGGGFYSCKNVFGTPSVNADALHL